MNEQKDSTGQSIKQGMGIGAGIVIALLAIFVLGPIATCAACVTCAGVAGTVAPPPKR